MQNNVDSNGNVIASGIAFVNLGSSTGAALNSVTFQSNRQPLIMESWGGPSPDQDAWASTIFRGQGIQIGLIRTCSGMILAPQQSTIKAKPTLETAGAAG